ncbi:MAG TPA: AAA family ATPase [Jiangellaceae bacterium]|nr:AAA family ATPase [Jiangellaceae bacterium]
MSTATWSASLDSEIDDDEPRSESAATPKAKRSTKASDSKAERAAERERKRIEAWAQAALKGEAETVRNTGKGERNDTLNVSALRLGQIVAGGYLAEKDVVTELTRAARDAGLGKDETKKTIASGLGAGKKEPRHPPPAEELDDSHDDGPGVDDYEFDELDMFAGGDDGEQSSTAELPQFQPKRTGKQKAPRLEIIESDALFAELEEPDYIIEGIVRRASLTEIVSYGGSGKTWIATNMLIAVGGGLPWLGRFAAKQGKALDIDYENGSYEMRRRIQANARALGLETVPGIGLISMPPLYMNAPEFGDTIEAAAAGYDLVIVDTLKAGNPGVDENDSNMRTGLDALRRVGEKNGSAFVVLVHSKKVSGNVTTIDPREAGRGSSAIYDAADTVLHVTYTEGQPLRVMQTKARLGRTVPPFQVEILDDDRGGVSVIASDVPKADPAASASDRFEAVCRAVLDAVRARPGQSGKVYRETLGLRHASVTAAFERLEHDGALKNAGTQTSAKWLPTGPGGVDGY